MIASIRLVVNIPICEISGYAMCHILTKLVDVPSKLLKGSLNFHYFHEISRYAMCIVYLVCAILLPPITYNLAEVLCFLIKY